MGVFDLKDDSQTTPGPGVRSKVAILTDSTCDLDPAVIAAYGIEVVPLHIVYGDREYRDRVDITPQEVYDYMNVEVPKTSLPSYAEIAEVFRRLQAADVTHVLAIHISSGLSGTYDTVCSIAREFKDMVVEVMDSKMLSMGLGFPVLEAARELQHSLDFYRAVAAAKRVIRDVKGFYVLSTLEYLIKGGRIGYVAGTFGQLLNIKPIISLNEEGKYYTLMKVRGREQSLRKLADLLKESVKEKISNVAIVHGGAEQEANELHAKAKELANIKELYLNQISPAMGVHTGPGLVGFLVYPVISS